MEYDIKYASGINKIEINDSINYKPKNIEVIGKCIQETRARGKNLFDYNTIDGFASNSVYGEIIKENNGYVYKTLVENAYSRIVILIPSQYLKENTTYTLSYNKDFILTQLGIGESNELIDTTTFAKYKATNDDVNKITFNVSTITKPYINIYLYNANAEVGTNWSVSDIQLEEGTEATTYEPYQPEMPSPELESPIKSVGDNYNLFDLSTVSKIGGNEVVTINGDIVNIKGQNAVYGMKNTFKLEKNTDYTVSALVNVIQGQLDSSYGWRIYNEDTGEYGSVSNKNTYTFNTGDYENFQLMYYLGVPRAYPTEANLFKVQLVKGVENLEYKPFGGPSIIIKNRGLNLLSNRYSDYSLGTYAYYRLGDSGQYRVIITDKDTSVDMTGVYFGLTRNGQNAGEGYFWVMSEGELKVSDTIQNLNYFSIYPANQQTFDKIFNRFNIIAVQGIESVSYEPYHTSEQIIELSEPLRGIEDVTDELNVDSMEIERKLAKWNIEWTNSIFGTLSNGNKFISANPPNKKEIDNSKILSNEARVSRDGRVGTVYSNAGNIVFVGTSTDTVETLRAKYDGSELIYELATPTTEELNIENTLELQQGMNIVELVGESIETTISLEYFVESIEKNKKIYVKNKNENIIAIFNIEDSDTLINPRITLTQNSDNIFYFTIPEKSEKWKVIKDPENLYFVDDKVFSTNFEGSFTEVLTENNERLINVTAYERQKLLTRKFVRAWNSETGFASIDTFMVVILSNGDLDLKNNDRLVSTAYQKGTSGYALEGLLAYTDWSVGECDVEGNFDLETDLVNIYDNILKIQELWGGILVFDSLNKKVHHRDETKYLPYSGYEVKYKKNMKSKESIYNNRIITKLCPLGESNLNIANVNDGSIWITNFEYTDTILEGIENNPDITDQEQLKAWGERKLKELHKPRKELTVGVVLLNKIEGYELEVIDLNHIVDVLDYEDSSDIEQLRVVSYDYGLWDNSDATVELSDITLESTDIFKKNVQASNDIVSGTLDASKVILIEENGKSINKKIYEVDEIVQQTKSEFKILEDEIVGTVEQITTSVDKLNNVVVEQNEKISEVEISVGNISSTVIEQESKINENTGKLEIESEKIAEQQIQIDEINSSVKAVVDTLKEVTGMKTITVSDAQNGPIISIKIKGNNQVFDSLFIDDNTLVDEETYIYGDSVISLSNETGTKEYELGINDVLRQSGNIYDEYIFESGVAKVIRRINPDGSIKTTEEIEFLELIDFELFKGENTIFIKNYDAEITIKYLTISEFTDTFANKIEVESKIQQKANEVEISINENFDGKEIATRLNVSSERIELDAKTISFISDVVVINEFGITMKDGSKIINANGLYTNLQFIANPTSTVNIGKFSFLGVDEKYGSTGVPIFGNQDLVFDIFIPDNFKVENAQINLLHSTVNMRIFDPSTGQSTGQVIGRSKNVKAYYTKNNYVVTATLGGSYDINLYGLSEVREAFGDNGYTFASNSPGTIEKTKSNNISTYLSPGYHKIVLRANANVYNSTEAAQNTGLAFATLDILGYLKEI